jgi:hypothetical protein
VGGVVVEEGLAMREGDMIPRSPIQKSKECHRCGRVVQADLVRKFIANGEVFFSWWCVECQGYIHPQNGGGLWIEKQKVLNALKTRNIDEEDIPIADYSCGVRCARCGLRGTDLHHWAPQALFQDADRWPTDYLCRNCHGQWHKIIDPKLIKQVLEAV